MKRKLFIAGATFVLVAAAVTAIAANQQTNEPTLLEANIEALGANGPGGGEGEGGSNSMCFTYCRSDDSYRCTVYINGVIAARCPYMNKK